MRDDFMVKNLFGSFRRDRENGYEYALIVENSLGSLRSRPYMRGERMETDFHRTEVDYCAYGKPYRKSTDIWTSFEWEPKGSTGNGKCCNGKCNQGTKNAKGKFRHRKVVAGENDRRVEGPHAKKQLWSIPQHLMEELLPQPTDTEPIDCAQPKYVFDLFSRGESWRKLVESQGYIYVPVDIKTLTAEA